MKVFELINELNDLDPEAEVVLQGDPEGNDYHLIRGVEGSMVYMDDKYESSVKYKKLTDELKELGYGPEDCYDPEDDGDDFVDAVVLFP